MGETGGRKEGAASGTQSGGVDLAGRLLLPQWLGPTIPSPSLRENLFFTWGLHPHGGSQEALDGTPEGPGHPWRLPVCLPVTLWSESSGHQMRGLYQSKALFGTLGAHKGKGQDSQSGPGPKAEPKPEAHPLHPTAQLARPYRTACGLKGGQGPQGTTRGPTHGEGCPPGWTPGSHLLYHRQDPRGQDPNSFPVSTLCC